MVSWSGCGGAGRVLCGGQGVGGDTRPRGDSEPGGRGGGETFAQSRVGVSCLWQPGPRAGGRGLLPTPGPLPPAVSPQRGPHRVSAGPAFPALGTPRRSLCSGGRELRVQAFEGSAVSVGPGLLGGAAVNLTSDP